MPDLGIHLPEPSYMQLFLRLLLVFRVLAYKHFNCVSASGTQSRRQMVEGHMLSTRTVRMTTCTKTLFENVICI